MSFLLTYVHRTAYLMNVLLTYCKSFPRRFITLFLFHKGLKKPVTFLPRNVTFVTPVRARRVLVFDTSRRRWRAAETSTRLATETDGNTEKAEQFGRGIAAEPLGDCRAHSETVIPVFYTVFAHSDFSCFSAFVLSRLCLPCPYSNLRPSSRSHRRAIIFYLPARKDKQHPHP